MTADEHLLADTMSYYATTKFIRSIYRATAHEMAVIRKIFHSATVKHAQVRGASRAETFH